MAFILEQDYDVLITSEQLAQITTDDTNISVCLLQSEEEVKEYLRHRFNVEFDMRDVTEESHPTDVTASVDDRLYNPNNGKFYVCIQDCTNEALTDTDYFTEGDDRNQKLVQITVDVFLYHLHTRLNPRNIPQHRKERYDGDGRLNESMSAIKWLLMIQKGTITPALTPIVDDDGEQIQTGQSIIYGNSPSLLTRTRDANTFLGS